MSESIKKEPETMINDPYEEVRIQNLHSFASSTPEQKVQWLEEMLEMIWEIRKQNREN